MSVALTPRTSNVVCRVLTSTVVAWNPESNAALCKAPKSQEAATDREMQREPRISPDLVSETPIGMPSIGVRRQVSIRVTS